MGRDRRTRTGARAPGVERQSRSNGGAPARTVPPAQNGDQTKAAESTKDGGKPNDARDASNGQALSDKPALKPYWGKPAVRKRDQEKQVCSMGDRPIEAKVRSLVAWIAGRRETEFPKPIDKAIFQDGEHVIGP